MTSAIAIARYIESKEVVFGGIHLLKLVYYSQAWSLTWTGRPLFDEDIEAWDMGPVTPSVWRQGKYGALDLEDPELGVAEVAIVDAVFAHYGRINGTSLSRMTHNESPWKDAWDDGRGRNSVISKSAMRRAYTEIARISPRTAPRAPVLERTLDLRELAAAADIEQARWATLFDRLAKE